MNKLHVDVYPIDETTLQITPISPATPANKEFSIALAPLNINAWNSYDILLSSFTGVDRTNIFQFKFTGTGGKTVYIDNLYFYSDATGISDINASHDVTCYPNPVKNNLVIHAKSEINRICITNIVGQPVMTIMAHDSESAIDMSRFSAGNYFVTVTLANGQLATQKFVKL